MATSFDVLKARCLPIVAAVLVALMAGLPSRSEAASPEQRCTELGANCLCAEALQMTALNPVFGSWWDPNDSTVKQCNGESASIGSGNAFITRNASDLQIGTDGAVLAALPAGHRVARYLKTPEGVSGIFEMGHHLAGAPLGRLGMRWYLYYSPNFVFSTSGGCLNSGKFASFWPNTVGPQMTTADGGGRWTTYGWVGWSPSLDCCNFGPGWDARAESDSRLLRGKWVRVELIIRNATGSPGLVFQVYRKNVTDNGPEYKVIDSSLPCVGCGTSQDWVGAATSALTPPDRITRLEINGFRNGTCTGYYAYSHAVVAAWSTDNGQRIGPAAEIEPATSSTRPASPGGLTVR